MTPGLSAAVKGKNPTGLERMWGHQHRSKEPETSTVCHLAFVAQTQTFAVTGRKSRVLRAQEGEAWQHSLCLASTPTGPFLNIPPSNKSPCKNQSGQAPASPPRPPALPPAWVLANSKGPAS